MSSVDLALFMPSLSTGGAARIMTNVGKYFSERGYEVEMVLARKEGGFLDEVENMNVVGFGSSVLGSLLPLRRYLRRREPDTVLSHTVPSNIVLVWAKILSRTSTRYIITEPSMTLKEYDNPDGMNERAIPLLAKHTYPRADSIIAVSEGIKTELVRNMGIEEESITVIYNPIETTKIRRLADEDVDHPWFEDEVPVVLGAGRLTEQKDFPTLVEAFSKVREEKECRLVILGEGHLRDDLVSLAEELDVKEDFELPGYVDSPYKYMKSADVFVLSSAWEGFGNVLVEAMACGTPVVSTDCESGPAEILEDGSYGRMVPVGDSKALADAITSTLEEPISSEILRRRAEDFTEERIMPAYEEVLFGQER